jgi:PAS domain S-box-containing protein
MTVFGGGLRSIRALLILLVAAVFLPLSVLVTILAVQYAGAQRHTIESGSRDACNALQHEINGELSNLKAMLLSLASSPELDSNGTEFERHARAVAAAANLNWVTLEDADGKTLLFAAGRAGASSSAAHAPQELRRAVLGGASGVSDVIASEGAEPTFVVSVPVVRNGAVAFTLSAASGLDRFDPLFNDIGLEGNWRAAVLDREGTFVAGRTYKGDVLKKATQSMRSVLLSGEREGRAEGVNSQDGAVTRTFERTRDGWVAFVSVPRSTLNAPLYRALRAIGIVGVCFALFALGLATLIAKKISDAIRSLSAAAVALVDGKSIPPVSRDIVELREVANAFDFAKAIADERDKVALRIEESEKQLRRVLDSLFAFVGVLDLEGVLIEANAEPIRVAGILREDVIGKPFWDCYWWSYSEAVQEQLKTAIGRAREGHVVRYDVDVRVKDGALITIDFQLAPIIVDGKVIQIIPSGLDITERKEAEQEVRKSEARFRSIFDNAAIGVALVGLKGEWIMVNDRLCRIVGYSREELLQKTFQEITYPADLEAGIGYLNKLVSGEIANYTMEKRYVGKDGSLVWAELTVSLRRSERGAPICFISIISDISERKRAEEAVKAAEQQERRRRVELETVLEAIPAAVLIAGDRQNTKVTANRTAYSLFRLPHDHELAAAAVPGYGSQFLDIVSNGRVLSAGELPVQVAAATGKPVLGTELDLRFADGEVKHLYGNALPLFDDEGEVQGAVGTFLDITDRKRAEDGRRVSEARLRRLQDSNIIGILTADSTLILEANRILLEMVGYGEEELRLGGIRWREITPPEHQAADDRALDQLRRLGFCEPYEKEFIRKDGTRIPVLIGAAETQRDPTQWVCFVLDLTERKQAENRIRFLMRELSHRSKNLLAVVQAMTFQTARSSASIEDFQRRLEERLQGLATSHDLLVKQDWQGVLFYDLARRQVAPFAGKNENRVTLSGPAVVLKAEASQSIGLALHELATNAVKYGALSAPQGHVTLTWSTSGGENPRFQMRWTERGGPPVHPPKRKGFGSAVIESMLASALDGEVKLEFNPEGLTWFVDVPSTCLKNPTEEPQSGLAA